MKNALVVDDTKNIRKLLKTCLQLKGFNVYEAGSGAEALQVVMSESLDIAFIDIKMTEMSGTEVLKKIRAMGLSFPVVMMTAFPTIKNAVDCTKLGAVAYLQKPFSADKISSLVDTLNDLDCSTANFYINSAKDNMDSDLELAYDYLKKALSMEPMNGEIYFLLSRIFEEKGDAEASAKFFKTAEEFGYKN